MARERRDNDGAIEYGDAQGAEVCFGAALQHVEPRRKGRILNDFAATTGFHRKHAMRLLRCDPDAQPAGAAVVGGSTKTRREMR